ncbi:MAG: hypothetical protein IJW96_03950, partial [Clostridia bacterium]|nr:hypothetical protein [Clostridia bacterium]
MAKKMKLFEKLFLFTVAVATTATMVWIPFNSYMEYQDYLAGLEQVTPGPATKKPVLEKIEAKLLDGVQYFANDMAEAKAEDFEVIAHYTVEGEDPYTETVEAGKFSVQTAADFYAKGGDVTISFRGKVATVPVTLVPVTLESINVTMTPYTIKYAAGSTFSNAGMIVNAVYNDGSTKELSEDEYVVDTETALKMGDK